MHEPILLHFTTGNTWVLNFCLAVIMFGVALELTPADFKRLLQTPRIALAGLFAQFVVLPAVTTVLVYLLKPSPGLALGMLLVACCPGGNISNFMSSLARANIALSVSLTAAGSFLAIFLTPLNLTLWGKLYAPASTLLREVEVGFADVLVTIVLIAGIPLLLGMVVRYYFQEVAVRLTQWLKPLSILIFLLFVVAAFAQNYTAFVQYIHLVFLLVLLHNALAFATGFFIARWSGASHTDQRTIAIETGIQNSGLGLALIFTFFNGMGEMVLVAGWWGIWHIVSGLTLSYYWLRLSPVTR